jgi:hypothetical protein
MNIVEQHPATPGFGQPLTSVRDGMLSRMTFALSRARRLGRPLRVVRGQ